MECKLYPNLVKRIFVFNKNQDQIHTNIDKNILACHVPSMIVPHIEKIMKLKNYLNVVKI